MHRLELELVIDSFAGGGGASLGIEQAIGRPVDIAVNHDRAAIAMHEANHPETKHYQEDVWQVDPLEATGGRAVALLWLSPDCTHHSKARGGKPRDKGIRGLAWVGLRWAARARPRVIILENVEEFRTWGPLNRRRRPKRNRKGETFDRWVSQLRGLGYEVEWRELRACDFGAPTSRKRLFVIARCDGEPITWPEPTHSNKPMLALVPYRTAAECIDWSIPCPSIFERPKPLAAATLRRIANGIKRYVIEAERPFVINLTHGGRLQPIDEPLATITGANRGEKALVAPYLAGVGGRAGQSPERPLDAPYHTTTAKGDTALVAPFLAGITHNKSGGQTTPGDAPMPTITTSRGGEQALIAPTLVQTGYGEREGQSPRSLDIEEPLGTVVGGGSKHALVAGFLAKHFGGHETPGSALDQPADTVTARDHHGLVASSLVKLYGTNDGAPVDAPMPVVTAGGNHLGEVRAFLAAYVPSEVVLRNGQRNSGGSQAGGNGRVRSTAGRDGMAAQGGSAERGVLPDHSPEGGESDDGRLPWVAGELGWESVSGVRPSSGVDGAEGANSGGHGSQPLRREQGEQPPVESGTGDGLGEHVPREPHGSGEASSASGEDAGALRADPGAGATASDNRPFALEDRRDSRDIADRDVPGSWQGQLTASFINAYYGNDKDGQAVSEPFRTVTSKERFGLVTVEGEPYAIVDIGMRMLAPRELFRAQGFPDGYVIDPVVNGRRLTKTDQIRMCGNSVCPPIARALVEANVAAGGQRNLWAGYEMAAAGGGS